MSIPARATKFGLFTVSVILAALIAAGPPPPGAAAGAGEGGAAGPVMMFSGRGRAHGVGLCMDGVLYRALDGHSYRDIINYYYTGVEFGRIDDGAPIRVRGRDGQVRTYSMKEYLYRLTEEPETYPAEGLKVLYVAARTYTLSVIDRGKHSAEGFDICSSGNCCQAFSETKDLSRYPNNMAAVDATEGQVLLYRGKPIIAAYHGSCGGHTENNEDVWSPNPIPYLRGRPDPYCSRSSRFAWTVRMRRSEVEERLNSSEDTRVGSLHSINFTERTPRGRVRRARLVGTEGTKVVTGTALAARLGLQSSLFDLVPQNFDQYLLVLNPSPEPNLLTFTFMQPDGGTSRHQVEVSGNSRYTLKVNDHLQYQEVSTVITAERPIIAERAMYFDYGGLRGGSASAGTPRPADRWYFAEGYTGGSFDTYILVQNPGLQEAHVVFTFMLPGGRTSRMEAQAPPTSRFTVDLGSIAGLENTEVSTLVESVNGAGIVADRSVYFDYDGIRGGNSEAGVAAPSTRWYLAEGYTGPGFDTYVLIQNPADEEARVEAVFMREDGVNVTRRYRLPPRSRHTIDGGRVEGLESAGFSTAVSSLNGVGVIAERAMYFDYGGIAGGHDGRGATSTLDECHFGEGYTGGDFDTWILIQNPNPEPAELRVRFTRTGGAVLSRDYTVRGNSRFTIPVDEIEGLEDAEVSTTIASMNGVGVVAERAMYFRYHGGAGLRPGGHAACATGSPSSRWYFAEGYTGY